MYNFTPPPPYNNNVIMYGFFLALFFWRSPQMDPVRQNSLFSPLGTCWLSFYRTLTTWLTPKPACFPCWTWVPGHLCFPRTWHGSGIELKEWMNEWRNDTCRYKWWSEWLDGPFSCSLNFVLELDIFMLLASEFCSKNLNSYFFRSL